MIKEETIRQLPGRRVVLVLLALAVVASLLLAPAAKPAQAAFPGKNGKIVFERAQVGVKAEIFTMNPDGTGQTNLTNDPATDTRPAVSSDGKKVAFTSDRDGNDDIFIMDTDPNTDDAVNLTNSSSARDLEPAFSPDGRIVFTTNRDGNAEIYVMDTDPNTDDAKNLTNFSSATEFEPAVSPGGKVAFTSDRNGNSNTYRMNLDGSGLRRLTKNPAEDNHPTFSPTGKKIAFVSEQDGNRNIYSMNAKDGTKKKRLTEDAAQDTNPAFSPDGTKIVFQSSPRSSGVQLFVMNPDGSNETPIPSHAPNNGTVDRDPDWAVAS